MGQAVARYYAPVRQVLLVRHGRVVVPQQAAAVDEAAVPAAGIAAAAAVSAADIAAPCRSCRWCSHAVAAVRAAVSAQHHR